MFGFKFKFGYAASRGTVAYNPLINYDWSTTTTSGLRYLKDVGSAPAYNASMYFGRGAYLNGVDQTITVPINTTIQTALKRVNGIVTINETSQALTNYVISGLGVHKDYYLFTRLLTTAEKDSYTNTPELFYAMAQADSTCVLNMPMCETDGYVRNMKSYSKGSELDTSFVANIYSSNALLRMAQFNLGLVVEANKTYLVEIEYDDTANSILTGYICYGEKGNGTYGNFHTELKGIVNGTKGTAFYLLQMPSTYLGLGIASAYAWITTTTSGKTAYISVSSLKELTGIYPITNYTTSVRDNAKNLQYGLQTCKFVRDSLGVIQSASDYLECDGVGYGLTSFNPKIEDGDYSFEATFYNESEVTNKTIFGNDKTNIISAGNGFIYITIHGKGLFIQYPLTNQYINICFTFNRTTGLISVYLNGVFVSSGTYTGFVNSIYNIGIATKSFNDYTYEKYDNPIRLLRVHNKVLTQAEITKNYNSYVAKGLLS